MPYAQAPHARLYYEEVGQGQPIIFVHEFAADYRAWESQLRHLSRDYRCIAFNARGYNPSDVPTEAEHYGCEWAASDIGSVLDHLAIPQAHVVGLSMGAYAAMLFAIRQPARVKGLVLAGIGSGSAPAEVDTFRSEAIARSSKLIEEGFAKHAHEYGMSSVRKQLAHKDPRAWQETMRFLSEHSGLGSGMTMRHYQAKRPTVYEYKAQLKQLKHKTLVIVGDEDEPCIDVSVYLKRTLENADLWIVPGTGHSVNLEEPTFFNHALRTFFQGFANEAK